MWSGSDSGGPGLRIPSIPGGRNGGQVHRGWGRGEEEEAGEGDGDGDGDGDGEGRGEGGGIIGELARLRGNREARWAGARGEGGKGREEEEWEEVFS